MNKQATKTRDQRSEMPRKEHLKILLDWQTTHAEAAMNNERNYLRSRKTTHTN